MATCNYIVKSGRTSYKRPKDQPPIRIPAVICGKPATHSLPPNHRLILCAEHARGNWGNSPPEPIGKRATKPGDRP